MKKDEAIAMKEKTRDQPLLLKIIVMMLDTIIDNCVVDQDRGQEKIELITAAKTSDMFSSHPGLLYIKIIIIGLIGKYIIGEIIKKKKHNTKIHRQKKILRLIKAQIKLLALFLDGKIMITMPIIKF